MRRDIAIRRRITFFFIIGIGLMGFAIGTPDPEHHHGLGFIQGARETIYTHPLDWEAAWCSLKIILFSLGLGLLIESVGAFFMRMEYTLLGFFVHLMHILPALGLLAGGYYLIKSLI
jgi:hypothetical protein